MEIRECTAEDVVTLLHCAQDNKETEMFDDWAQHQKWLLDAVYNKSFQVLVADDGYGVIGYTVWSLYQSCFKWEAYVHHIFVMPDFRNSVVAPMLITQLMKNVYNSSAQRLKFETKVLPKEWVELITSNVPSDKYTTYYIPRTEELKEWYNENIR